MIMKRIITMFICGLSVHLLLWEHIGYVKWGWRLEVKVSVEAFPQGLPIFLSHQKKQDPDFILIKKKYSKHPLGMGTHQSLRFTRFVVLLLFSYYCLNPTSVFPEIYNWMYLGSSVFLKACPSRQPDIIFALFVADTLSSCKSRETSTTVGSCVKPLMRPCWLPTSFKVIEGDRLKWVTPLAATHCVHDLCCTLPSISPIYQSDKYALDCVFFF